VFFIIYVIIINNKMKYNNYYKKTKGFTLIELLVVVAIIGVLSSVVFVVVSSARERANEKAIFSNLRSVINTAEIYITQNGIYPTPAECLSVFSTYITALDKLNTVASCYILNRNLDWGFSLRAKNDINTNYSVNGSGIVYWDLDTKSANNSLTWTEANTYCSNLGGRLPTLDQFFALRNTYLSEIIRPLGSDTYWTSTDSADNNTSAWFIRMSSITNGVVAKHNLRTAVCVKPI